MHIFIINFKNINEKYGKKEVRIVVLKGVNKRIIEINNVEGGYFEKILFFVSDDRKESDSILENQAQKYVADSCALKFRRRIFTSDTVKFILKMALSAGAGLAVGILLL